MPSGPFVLKQSAWTPKPSFPFCIKPGTLLKDGFVEVKFKPLSGTNDQAAGLVWRYRDANNYYVVRANALEDNVVLYKVEQGKRKALDIASLGGIVALNREVDAATATALAELERLYPVREEVTAGSMDNPPF